MAVLRRREKKINTHNYFVKNEKASVMNERINVKIVIIKYAGESLFDECSTAGSSFNYRKT